MDNEYNVYEDINTRTGGELYLGIVGPVRTGKSTFIKNFMELMVIPEMQDEAEKCVPEMNCHSLPTEKQS